METVKEELRGTSEIWWVDWVDVMFGTNTGKWSLYLRWPLLSFGKRVFRQVFLAVIWPFGYFWMFCSKRMGVVLEEIQDSQPSQQQNPKLSIWEEMAQEMMKNGITEFYECGPMKQLKVLHFNTNREHQKRTDMNRSNSVRP